MTNTDIHNLKSDVIRTLKSEVANMLERSESSIDEGAHFAGLGMDSLQALQLLVLLERTYKIEIREDELAQFTSIGAIADLVEERAGAAAMRS